MSYQESTWEQGKRRNGLIETEDLAKTRKGDLGKEKRNEKEAEKNPLEAEISKVQTGYSLSLSHIDEQAEFVHVASGISSILAQTYLEKIVIFWVYCIFSIERPRRSFKIWQ